MPYPQYNSNPRQGSYSGGQQKRSGSSQISSQTDGVMFSNESMGKFMRTRFWNRCMGIDIGTFAPGMPLDFNVVRNAQVFGHVFTFSALFELKDVVDEVLESLRQTNMFESTAIEAGSKKDVVIEISNGNNINQPQGIYLVIYKNVDTGKRTNTFEMYPFGKTKTMRNYDHNTGSFTPDVSSVKELKKFRMVLNEAAKSFTMAQAHAIRDAEKMDRLSVMAMLTAMSAGLGVDVNAAVSAARVNGQAMHDRASQGSRPGGDPSQFQRRSTGGQWNRGGAYGQPRGQFNAQPGNPGGNGKTNYQNTQAAMAALTDEPVDINLDAATLQQVGMDKFS